MRSHPHARLSSPRGAADAILLPTLLRQATGHERLDYQVAPGLANVTSEAVANLDLTAARVAYLVDKDQGGRDRRKHLRDAGIPASRILDLTGGQAELTLEDLVQRDVYLGAVNRVLGDWSNGVQMPAEALPDRRRVRAVEAWCEAQPGLVEPPSKRAVANVVVDQRHERDLVAANRRAGLRGLHSRIERLLSKPMHASGGTGS